MDWKFQIIQDTQTLYSPVSIKTFNKPLDIILTDDTPVGAAADHTDVNLKLIIYKGLLDSPRLTPDGLRMIICHELGHLFGGSPRRNVPMEWDGPIAHDGLSHLSSEGQADYYASLVCFRKMVEVASAEGPVVDYKRVGPKLKHKCEVRAGYKGIELKNCLRAGLAGEDFLKLTFEFPVSCEKEDTSVTDRLIRDSYPGRQCRLDTIVSGALCPDKLPMALDFDNMANTTCRNQIATRPQCWFK